MRWKDMYFTEVTLGHWQNRTIEADEELKDCILVANPNIFVGKLILKPFKNILMKPLAETGLLKGTLTEQLVVLSMPQFKGTW